MKLPKSISPCPIRESAAGVQFETNVPPDAVFGIVYQALQKDFGEAKRLPILDLPAEIRTAEKDLAFQPYYQLENKTSVVLIGPKMATVGMRGNYLGWAEHSKQIKQTLLKIYGTGIATKILRFGLRYISFFDFDIYPNLALKIVANDKSMEGEETLFRTVFNGSHFKSILKIQKDVVLLSKPGEKGSVIDIDLFKNNPAGEFAKELEAFLENAHNAEKELFFGLLKAEFLSKLNPVYENGN